MNRSKSRRVLRSALRILALVSLGSMGLLGGSANAASAQEPSTEVPVVREMAVTFDDLPSGGGRVELVELISLTETLLESLKQHEVPAVGFVNEGKLYELGELDERVGGLGPLG